MREILFRGKRISNSKWVEGFMYSQHFPLEFRDDFYIRCYDTDYLVLPETVGQYTGLTDKNGVRIFEGDILKSTIKFIDCNDEGYSILHHDIEDIGIVEWRKDGFMIAHKSGTWARSFYGCENYVIGNIHDNPDILKGGEDNG